MNVVPILPLKKYNSAGRIQHLNAYALDFFKHGSQKVIEKENGLVSNKIIHGIEFLQESTHEAHAAVSSEALLVGVQLSVIPVMLSTVVPYP